MARNEPRVDTKRVNQEKANFNPGVLPIMVGTTVEWPNNDDIYHNVFSMSDAKEFDLGLYKGNPKEKRVTFDKPRDYWLDRLPDGRLLLHFTLPVKEGAAEVEVGLASP